MTRIGFVTQLGMAPRDAFHHARDMGADHVEIMMDGDTDREALMRDADAIVEAAEDAGLDLLAHLPFSLDIGSPHEHVRDGSIEELRACIETAATLGMERVVVHADSRAWDPAWDDVHIQNLIVDAVRELDESAADHAVELTVENIPDGFFTVHDFHRIFDETDAMMTLDTGHARVDGMEAPDIAAFLEEHRDRISHLHINDTRVAEDGHVPFGSGTLDFDTVIDPVRTGWQGTMSLEVFTYDWDYIAYSLERLEDLL